jgi:hypothetical protein
MNYIRIHIHAELAEQEILLSLLTDFDAVGFEQGDDFLLAYFPEDNLRSQLLWRKTGTKNGKVISIR